MNIPEIENLWNRGDDKCSQCIPKNKVINIYTDGSFHADKKIIGWGGVFVVENKVVFTASGSSYGNSSIEAELIAVIESLKLVPEMSVVKIFTDSLFIVSTHNNGNKSGVWKLFNKLLQSRMVMLNWIKGHNGNVFNEQADRLARSESVCLRKALISG